MIDNLNSERRLRIDPQGFSQFTDRASAIIADAWSWERCNILEDTKFDFGIGTDSSGTKVLTKLSGTLLGYRELVFSRLSSLLGWSHQKSTFASFSPRLLKNLGKENWDEFNVISEFLEEHICSELCVTCPNMELTHVLRTDGAPTLSALKTVPIKNLVDWPKTELAAFLFGAGESSQKLITKDFCLVMIDSEQMFASGPTDPQDWRWWNDELGLSLALEVCDSIGLLTDQQLDTCLQTPNNIVIPEMLCIKCRVYQGRKSARNWASILKKTRA